MVWVVKMKKLIGKIIIKVEKTPEDDALVFTDGNGDKFYYQVYGECCSATWFAHIAGIKSLLGNKVNSVENKEEFTDEEQKKAEEEQEDYDVLNLYGILLKTDKGTCDIEFRNDSNGYYGGSCVYSPNPISNVTWVNIDKDY